VLPRIYSDRVKTTFHVRTPVANFLCSIVQIVFDVAFSQHRAEHA
jgi:hypothetical protein